MKAVCTELPDQQYQEVKSLVDKGWFRNENEGRIIVPAVVLAEIMFIARKGRVTISFDETLW